MAEQTAPAAAEPKTKKKKKKGPIRTEAVVPFLIFVAIVWAYFFFFFDTHLRHGMEYVGTNANGAEVNIGNVRTSFWKASLEINEVQVTDVDAPMKNKIQIEKMRWKMMWDALLRGKIAIEDASILEIAIGAPRKRPGRVLPPEPPSGKSAFDKVREAALAKAQDEFSKNVLGDAASILGGADPSEQLKNIQGSLKAETMVKGLQEEFAKKEAAWKQRLASLPQAKDFDDLQKRLKAVKKDNFGSPQELQTSIQQFDGIYKEADAKIKAVQETKNAIGTDSNVVQTSLKDLEATVRQDIKDLEARLKIPTLDVKSLSKSIFGPLFLTKVKQAEFYMAKARTYMPPKKTAEEKAEFAKPKAHAREKGINYKFGRPNSYPLFWLKHAAISSKYTKGADWSGDVVGKLIDVTDDPPVLGRPTLATFKGDFPAMELMGVDGKVTIDHRTDDAVDRLDLKVGSFPVMGQKLIDSDEVILGFDKAVSSSKFMAELRGKNVKIELNSLFKRPKADQKPSVTPEPSSAGTPLPSTGFLSAQAKQPILNEILNGALNDIPEVTLNANVQGPWNGLAFGIDSNLGTELAKAFDKQIQLKIAEARAKIQALVNERIETERAKLTAEFNKAKAQVDNVIKEKQAEVDKFKKQVETAKNEAVNSQKKKLEGEGQKVLDDLKNKFKF
ncbi:MAG: TIGR03545 family protein [Bdellovibrionota bacterium]